MSSNAPLELVVAYAHEDLSLYLELEKQLLVLQRDGLVNVWSEERIAPGTVLQEIISERLHRARVVLLLLSPDFFASTTYWLGTDIEAALARQRRKQALVIPILLRPCTLPQGAIDVGTLLPASGHALTILPNIHQGIADVVSQVQARVRKLREGIWGDDFTGKTNAKLILREMVDSLVALSVAQEKARRDGDLASTAYTAREIERLASRVRQAVTFENGSEVAGARLVQEVGAGAYATVWVANVGSTQTAVKVFHLQNLTRGIMLWRFRRGIRAVQHLTRGEDSNKTIVPIDQIDETGLAFSMPYVPRGTLDNIETRKWAREKKIDIVLKVSRAVEFAHSRGVLHRDIKPANIIIDDHEEPRLTDFDIADFRFMSSLTTDKGGSGTLQFAAPEQLSGDPTDERVDVYGLGRLLHYLLCERPLAARSTEYVDFSDLRSHPHALIAIVRKATAHKKEDRYRSVTLFRAALDNWSSRQSTITALLSAIAEHARRHQATLVVVMFLVLLAAAFAQDQLVRYEKSHSAARTLEEKHLRLALLWDEYQKARTTRQEEPIVREAIALQDEAHDAHHTMQKEAPLFFRPRPQLPLLPAGSAIAALEDPTRDEPHETPPPLPAPGTSAPSPGAPVVSLSSDVDDAVLFNKGEAIGQVGTAVERARACWSGGDYTGTVSATVLFFSDGTTKTNVEGDPTLDQVAAACVQRHFAAVRVGAFAIPQGPVPLLKRFRVVER